MIKSFCVLLIFISFFQNFHACEVEGIQAYEFSQHLKAEVNPQTTVFAFDLHKVIFTELFLWRVCICARATMRGFFYYALNPWFWLKAKEFIDTGKSTEFVFKSMLEVYPGLSYYQDDYFEVANAHAPDHNMVSLLASLKQLGYKLYVLSNIGEEAYSLFFDKHPEVFNCFEDIYIPRQSNEYNCKPHESFYNGFSEFIKDKGDGDKQVIFVDDLRANINAALRCNIAGIHFTTPYDLVNILEDLGITIELPDCPDSYGDDLFY